MQSVTITINCENAAFHADDEQPGDDSAARVEVASILRTLARHFESGPMRARIYDRNGNAVGTVSIHD
jgi:hypothetical protein